MGELGMTVSEESEPGLRRSLTLEVQSQRRVASARLKAASRDREQTAQKDAPGLSSSVQSSLFGSPLHTASAKDAKRRHPSSVLGIGVRRMQMQPLESYKAKQRTRIIRMLDIFGLSSGLELEILAA